MEVDLKEGKRREWTDEEDLRLRELVQLLGVKRWALIATKLGGRIGKQCRERWTNHLADDISKEPWTEEEEGLLHAAMVSYNKKWATIAKLLPGRTENAVKNHWNASIRRNERTLRKTGGPEGGGACKADGQPVSRRRGASCLSAPAQLTVLGFSASPDAALSGSGTPGGNSLGYNTPTLNLAAEQLSAHHRLARTAGAGADTFSDGPLPLPAARLDSPDGAAVAASTHGAIAGAPPSGARAAALARPIPRGKRPAVQSADGAPTGRARARARAVPGGAAEGGEAPAALWAVQGVEPLAPHAAQAPMSLLAVISSSATKDAVRGLRRALEIGTECVDGQQQLPAAGVRADDEAGCADSRGAVVGVGGPLPLASAQMLHGDARNESSCPLLSLATAATAAPSPGLRW